MIRIKGLRDGLLVLCAGDSWQQDFADLETKLTLNPGFFRGGAIAVDAKDFALTRADLELLDRLLTQHDVRLTAIATLAEPTRRLLESIGVATTLPGKSAGGTTAMRRSSPVVAEVVDNRPPSVDAPVDMPARALQSEPAGGAGEFDEGIVIRRRVRAGQMIRHPGHITVIGDVNPGATLVAGGDIIVWGRLQGTVHAGAFGDAGAAVYALHMAPTVIRIADSIQLSSNRRKVKAVAPEVAAIQGNDIMIAGWDTQPKMRG